MRLPQIICAKNYLSIETINQLKKEGILAPRFDFVRVFINGEAWGIYALEEFFTLNSLHNLANKFGKSE